MSAPHSVLLDRSPMPGGEGSPAPRKDVAVGFVHRRLRVRGTVQGVGFRPFVYRLATELGLQGWVRNDAQGVEMDLRGPVAAIDALAQRLRSDAPPLARITAVEVVDLPTAAARGIEREPARFAILASAGGRAATSVTADAAVCADCLSELFDPADRRYRYPFINCTHCGPRYTITRALPYDRPQTSMAAFVQCPACQREYDDPADRRFHAQPNACPSCGPRLSLVDRTGAAIEGAVIERGVVDPAPSDSSVAFDAAIEGDPIANVVALLAAGKIVAIKGLGGFHLACDARNAAAVAELRRRKAREEKPFAVMVANARSAAALVSVGDAERALLATAASPIVLLAKRPGCDRLLAGVAPGLAWLGVMLPYTPLQWLLFHEAAGRPSGQGWMADEHPLVLVMTSANPGGEPIVRDDGEALARLGGIADALLLHDRAIVTRCDDSVVRVARDLPRDGARNETRDGSRSGAGNETCDGPRMRSAEAMREPAREGAHPVDAAAPVARFIRRARGFTPQPIRLPAPGPSVLATGGFLKNTVCLTRGDEAFLSQHIGDLDNAPTCAMLDETVARLCDLLRIEPDVVAHDLHPDFYSTRFAAAYAGARGLPAIAVQHHHAHVASVVAEHRRRGPVLGLALDGVGLGADGTAWGGELLRVDGHRCERLGHLAPLALPGGDRAAREPWRMAAAALHRIGRRDEIAGRFPGRSGDALATMLDRGVGCPPTTSLGRWFDAAAGLLRVREVSAFEGQAAMLLEGLAAAHGPVSGLAAGYAIAGGVLDFSPLVACIADLAQRTAVERYLAALFHATVADGLVAWVREAAAREGLDTVALGGGCMMNDVLSTALVGGLRRAGVTPLVACSAPPNDGGLALGQAWVAVETALAGDPR